MSTSLGTIHLDDGRKDMQGLSVTRFFGGADRGPMIQLTIHSGSTIVASPQDMKDALLDLALKIKVEK